MLSEKPRISLHRQSRHSATPATAIVGMIVGAPALQKDEDDKHHEKESLAEGHDDVMHRLGYEACRVVVHRIGDSVREALRQLLHPFLDASLKVERVRPWHLEDREDDCGVPSEKGGRRILQRAQLHAAPCRAI